MSATTAAFPTAPPAQPEFPRHVVTAVLVSHDGARWLPDALAGLLGQERPVQYAVAADTGSADESARLVGEAIGDERVLHLARRTGFGAAVGEAVRAAPVLGPDDLPYLRRPSGWDPVGKTWRDDAHEMPDLPHGEPVQWLWLLHDDCAPAPDALAELLRVADSDEYAAIVGPKLLGWYDRKQLLEVGVTIARSGRRWTGLDRREQDQGQHDQIRPVLAVSTAGMLVRRDVFEELGGFDRHLPLMRDDVDLCWRAHAAGHRVLVAPDAVLRHAEAASRERRTVDCAGRSVANPHRVDKAGAVYTLLANTRAAALPYVLVRLVLGTLLRTLAYLVGKAPVQAVDEVMGLCGVLLRPERIVAARRRAPRAGDPAELRPLFPPPGATVRAAIEQAASDFGGHEADAGGSRHGAVESGPGGDDADYLEVEQFTRLRKIAHKPGPVLFALLLLVSLIACRGLLGGGSLAGGALLPVPDGVGDLWSRYADAWHPLGTGGTQSAPPYLALLAALSGLFLGSTGFAVTVLLVCSVPLAGFTAYFASRSLVESRLLRAWAAVAYAFLPAATGALATGRLGTAVLAILLPLMARAAVAAYGLRGGGPGAPRGSWRATWAYALLLTFTTAFTPVVWPLAVVLGLAALVLRRDDLTAYGLRLLAVAGTPLLVLAPWSLSLLTEPAAFLREAGTQIRTGPASALDLLGTSPGGPRTVGGLVLLGLVLAALAALLRAERRFAVRSAWTVALVALLFAVVTNGAGDRATGWAGPATLVYGLALIAAGALGAEGGRTRVAAQSFGWRQPVAALVALAAAAGPLVSAANWMIGGAAGPLERRDPVQVPAFVAEESVTRDQPRTLVLDGTSPAKVAYVLLRGSGARLGDAELTAAGGGDPRLDKVVAHLVAGSGADQAAELGGFAVRYVLVRDGAPREMARVLDATPGLSRLSQRDGSALWRVDRQVARAVIVPAATGAAGSTGAGAEPVPVGSGPVEAHGDIPAGAEGRVLRIADRADDGWHATLDGRPLEKTTVDGWAQGFRLPAQGGRLDLTYDTPLTRTAWTWTQCALAVVLLVLALPGRRRDVDDDLPEEQAATAGTRDATGDGRRARRLRAAAPDTAPAPAPDPAAGPHAVPAPRPEPQEPPGTDRPAAPAHPAAQGYDDRPAYERQPHGDQDHGRQPAYGGQSHAHPHDGAPYGQDPYGQDPYPQSPYGQDPYGQGPQGPYDPNAYAGRQDGDQQYAGPQYGDGQYDGQPYPYPYPQQNPYGPYDPSDPYGRENEQRPDGSSHQ
ncbi:glycosyltransferase family 2 protein [Streptomyces sudanensis]|uniref:glycosyltransferase family 2 protein n=1 Tax=Streptomyces sudanensis TaxID=436397 RepID=UPI0020CEFB83|nr:glycosyltransferase family 2 protein [Streptomyces sudanensis]MCP9958764.1 glycosyltransferase family 2 protein [Streptomyces sudanensis]MCQ0000749.1 glycosyltransferase family 2 protein [Streptomyces sudanensis]